MNSSSSTVTFHSNTVNTSNLAFAVIHPAPRRGKPGTAARLGRSLARNWEMLGVSALMLSSTVYGVYALTCLTGF